MSCSCCRQLNSLNERHAAERGLATVVLSIILLQGKVVEESALLPANVAVHAVGYSELGFTRSTRRRRQTEAHAKGLGPAAERQP